MTLYWENKSVKTVSRPRWEPLQSFLSIAPINKTFLHETDFPH